MKFVLTFLAIFILFSSEKTGAVEVISGQHADFSRVVFIGVAGRKWRAIEAPRGVYIQFAEGEVSFDFSRVFRRIDRQKVKDYMDFGDGSVFLEYACRCSANIFEVSAGLVVDVELKNLNRQANESQINVGRASVGEEKNFIT